jgi:hypothetical protein
MLIASVTTAGCNFSAEQKVETSVITNPGAGNASSDFKLVARDSAEFAHYKIESEKKLRENELLIADMRDKMNSEKKTGMANSEKQLDSLEVINSRLRNDMRMFSSQSKAVLDVFKKNFNKELEAIGKSISLLAERNVKKGS